MLLNFQLLDLSSQRGTVTDTVLTSDTNLLSSFSPILMKKYSKLLVKRYDYYIIAFKKNPVFWEDERAEWYLFLTLSYWSVHSTSHAIEIEIFFHINTINHYTLISAIKFHKSIPSNRVVYLSLFSERGFSSFKSYGISYILSHLSSCLLLSSRIVKILKFCIAYFFLLKLEKLRAYRDEHSRCVLRIRERRYWF